MRFANVAQRCFGIMAATAFVGAAAQNIAEPSPWIEGDVPPPPAFDIRRSVDIPSRGPSSLTIGIDPATITVGADQVIRVVVMTRNRDGQVTGALYEGLRCTTGEFRTYARHFSDDGWKPVKDSVWKPLRDAGGELHLNQFARAGLCMNTVPNGTPANMVRAIKNSSPHIAGTTT